MAEKLRGKRVKDGKWIYGNSIFILPNDKTCIGCPDEEHSVISLTINQYAGIEDIHGKKVFGNDIVCLNEDYCIIKEFKSYFGEFKPYFEVIGKHTAYWLQNCANLGMELCGNVFDNPELANEILEVRKRNYKNRELLKKIYEE